MSCLAAHLGCSWQDVLPAGRAGAGSPQGSPVPEVKASGLGVLRDTRSAPSQLSDIWQMGSCEFAFWEMTLFAFSFHSIGVDLLFVILANEGKFGRRGALESG